jgi:putative redox protein
VDIARIKWTGGRQFLGVDAVGHSVVMDAKPEFKGEGSGIRPIELVLHALAGCTAMDVISILEKKRQSITHLEVIARGDQRVDDYPKIYTAVELEYVVTGTGVDPRAVERAIELSEEKYCAVKGMLGPDVGVTTRFRCIEQSDGEADAAVDQGTV